jgi:hypothetical protein
VAQRVAKVMSEDERPAPDAPPDDRPTAVDLIAGGQITLVVNSPRGRGAQADGAYIRRAATCTASRASPPRPRALAAPSPASTGPATTCGCATLQSTTDREPHRQRARST